MVTNGTTTTSDGTTIAWDRRGSGSPMLLVHGITDNRRSWDLMVDDLAADHDVITMDLRGHGESAKADDYSLVRMVTDIAEVCADAGFEAPVLVGHSLGGLLVTAAGGAVGARAVMNVDQGLELTAMSETVATLADQLRDPATFHATLGMMFSAMESPGLDEASAAAFTDAVATADQDVVLGVWGPMLDGPDPDVDAQVDAVLATLTMPYLSWHGMDPGPGYEAWLRERVPHAQFELLDGEGHFVHQVDPARFTARLRAFLAE